MVHHADNVGRDDTLELSIGSRHVAALTTRQDVSVFESSLYRRPQLEYPYKRKRYDTQEMDILDQCEGFNVCEGVAGTLVLPQLEDRTMGRLTALQRLTSCDRLW